VPGQLVATASGDPGTVDAVRWDGGPATIWNLTVDVDHTFFVGDGRWWVHNACPYQGGLIKDLDGGPGIERNHIPARAATGVSRRGGIGIEMDVADHMQTSSWGGYATSRTYRAAQQALVAGGRIDDAIMMDIDDGTKDDQAILQMIDAMP
jgi:hypothetical protein